MKKPVHAHVSHIVIVGGVAGGASVAAKAPGIMAGFDAVNARRGEVKTPTGEELQKNWLRIPRDHNQELNPTKETVVYCRVGLRRYLAARILLHHGFTNVYNLTGGILSYLRMSANT